MLCCYIILCYVMLYYIIYYIILYYVLVNGHDRTITVILAKHCIRLPDDGSLVIRNMLQQIFIFFIYLFIFDILLTVHLNIFILILTNLMH